MTTLVRLGMLVPPFRSGTSQDRHAPAGRADTPVTRLGRTSSYQVTPGPSGRVHLHAALSGRPTAPGMTPRSGRFRVRPVRQDHPHDQGPPPSSLAVQIPALVGHGKPPSGRVVGSRTAGAAPASLGCRGLHRLQAPHSGSGGWLAIGPPPQPLIAPRIDG